METIYFYAPKALHKFFNHKDLDWTEITKARHSVSGNFTSWILTTYIQLKNAGLSCQVIDSMPKKGIVIADRDTLGNKYPYFSQVMLICAKGDREFHPSAHLHIVHNPNDSKIRNNLLWNSYYIPHWPQPSLIPRSKERHSLVKNVAFMGSRSNLAQELLSEKWMNALNSLECHWNPIVNKDLWNDYSKIDLIVAIRRFAQPTFYNKPASKLVNAWSAGVPAILPSESAYSAIRKSQLDFWEISSLDEAIDAVKQLKNNPELYMSMVQNGLNRSQEFSHDKITEDWITSFDKFVFPKYREWLKMSEWQRKLCFMNRYARLKLDRMEDRMEDIFKKLGF